MSLRVTKLRLLALILVIGVVASLIVTFFLQTGSTQMPTRLKKNVNAVPSAAKVEAGTIEAFYAQKVEWKRCDINAIRTYTDEKVENPSSYECAALSAPLDWDDPAGEQITLSVAVHRSGTEGAPALFYNLGGPGGPAVESIVSQVEDNLGDRIVAAYDIVAVDPRGVGASTPVKCLTDEQKDMLNTEGTLTAGTPKKLSETTPERIIEVAQKDTAIIAEGCQKLSGDLFKHIDTVSAARDFDMIRAVMGQEKFTYLGYSYGTFLGATYADLFPDRVGRLVLDGAIDPSMSGQEVSDLQMRGFEAAIEHWIEVCVDDSTCPLSGTKDEGVATIAKFLDDLADAPLETSDKDRPLTQNLALTAIIGMMYSTDSYQYLNEGMTQALENRDGSILLFLADFLNEREDSGVYLNNSTEAIIAINNADYPPSGTPETWAAGAAVLEKELPVFGQFSGYTEAGIAQWPTAHGERKKITAEGAPPILVVGTTHDPATPYIMAQNLAAQLSSGVLVTSEGWSHTAYSKDAGTCVVDAVEGHLVDGVVPDSGLTCPSRDG